MNVEKTKFEGLFVITPLVFGDERGWFMESFSCDKLSGYIPNIPNFIQDNQSFSKEINTFRGMHCQTNPKAQTKLIRCTRGAIVDYVIDVRKNSPTYLKGFQIELSELNKKQLYIPKGFLHGFKTLTENVEVQYKVDEYYSKECDRSIYYLDPSFDINFNLNNPILSAKDKNAPKLNESDVDF